jgi:nucleotide-binding universal stress UspA family protein
MVNQPIVVGYDGSAGADLALRWALDEAARLGAAVHLVYAVDRPLRAVPVPPMPGDAHAHHERATAQSAVAKAVAEACRAVGPGVQVTGAVLDGPPVTVLCAESAEAHLLVLGGHGWGSSAGLFVGSVSVAVATHAHCPVVVVRDGDPLAAGDRPVAVGVDQSGEAERAIELAFEEAATRGVGLIAVRAWIPPTVLGIGETGLHLGDIAVLEKAERHLLAEAVGRQRQRYPSVAVTERLIPAAARHALASVSNEAQLLVVGSRGHGGFGGLLLGSVGYYLLHHASCPVAIVPGHRTLTTPSGTNGRTAPGSTTLPAVGRRSGP